MYPEIELGLLHSTPYTALVLCDRIAPNVLNTRDFLLRPHQIEVPGVSNTLITLDVRELIDLLEQRYVVVGGHHLS